MDGQRARRQKSGSPLGRIVDEANDLIQQSLYSIIFLVAFRFDNYIFEFGMMMMLNAIFYCMESNFILTGGLNMILGEFGPVEAELLSSFIIISIGYFGSDGVLLPIGSTFPAIAAPDHLLNKLAPV
jgi:phosphatidylglycerophosphate synthase